MMSVCSDLCVIDGSDCRSVLFWKCDFGFEPNVYVCVCVWFCVFGPVFERLCVKFSFCVYNASVCVCVCAASVCVFMDDR